MIFDDLKNVELYYGVNEYFRKVHEFIQKNDLETLEVGVYEIVGRDVYAQVQEYQTKRPEEKKWEAHRKYIDFQYLVHGSEYIGYNHLRNMQVLEYQEEKDFVVLAGKGDFLTLRAGNFAIFYPHDAHMPGVALEGAQTAKKVVFKIKVK